MPPKGKTRIMRTVRRPATVEEAISQAKSYNPYHLDLSQWEMTEIPKSMRPMSDLRELDLSGNKITALPRFISKWSKLLVLDLGSNYLVELPDEIGQLRSLRELRLRGNRLTQLPDIIGELTQLEVLDLSNNRFSALPESIGRLSQLRQLILEGNNITELPESLRRLESLKELYLHGNYSLDMPAEVLGPTASEVQIHKAQAINPREILEYYFRIRRGRHPLNEAKLILVGRGAVGKTSIVNQLIFHRFDKDEKKTEGINITEWTISLGEGEVVRLNVWDFGGQEIMHATHQFFLTQRSLYLLVLSGREGGEDKDAEYWLKLIESFGNESPVIVVLNKIKEQPFDLNRRALKTKYPFIVGFVRTDCEDATGIQELRKLIEHETDSLEHLRDAFPSSWFVIKDTLSRMKKNYLTYGEYRRVCAENGETNRKAQDTLSTYLHNLGIVLNYKDDPRLHDTHVLNPHWVTRGIYNILNSAELAECKGEIQLEDLVTLLDEDEYPRSMHRFIFDLMKKFELCFSYPDDECQFLIPELLDKQEPEETAAFNIKECLNFEYHYPILPEGLVPRFIVRTHSLSDGSPRWRSGVILRFGDSRALVKADAEDRKVFIHVTGGSTRERGELLAIIRSDFERIHFDIRNLQPQEMVPVPNHPDTVLPYQHLRMLEKAGVKKLPQVVGAQVVDLYVNDLLNGVDLPSERIREVAAGAREEALRLFYSYSRKDEMLRDELENHLKILQRQGMITPWHDRNIDAGDEWRRKIDENLELADIVLLLVSADFMASDYCYETEMLHALEQHEKGEARVIPVIVRDVMWEGAPFGKLQALPKDGKAVTLWPDRDTAWRNVSEGIQKAVEEVRNRRRS